MTTFNRPLFFDAVRERPFSGTLAQGQVDGMSAILHAWEKDYSLWDLRWLAYCLATTFHETASEMQPIEEYGKGEGMSYGKPDPTTGETYYGRGYVQLTWGDNYRRADTELSLDNDASCYWHADNALDPSIASEVMFVGMRDGWFRTSDDGTKETLQKYFNDTRDDPFGAREIVNGDKTHKPEWAHGKTIGDLIAGYHDDFLAALNLSLVVVPPPDPSPGMYWPHIVADLRIAGNALKRIADNIETGTRT
jgi:hypothetical protein